MNLEVILRAGLSTGTILIFASIGEILAERSGVMNLGVEGMMLMGAMAAFKVSHVTQNAWLGLLAGILAGGLLGFFQADVRDLPAIGIDKYADNNADKNGNPAQHAASRRYRLIHGHLPRKSRRERRLRRKSL